MANNFITFFKIQSNILVQKHYHIKYAKQLSFRIKNCGRKNYYLKPIRISLTTVRMSMHNFDH
jgi:hypothetical protein